MKIADGNTHLSGLPPLQTRQSVKAEKDFNQILQQAVDSGDQKRLYKACQDMESVLVSKMLESMRQTIPRSDWMGDSFAMDTYESMLYDEYARLSSQTGSLGIADMLYRQLHEDLPTAGSGPKITEPAPQRRGSIG